MKKATYVIVVLAGLLIGVLLSMGFQNWKNEREAAYQEAMDSLVFEWDEEALKNHPYGDGELRLEDVVKKYHGDLEIHTYHNGEEKEELLVTSGDITYFNYETISFQKAGKYEITCQVSTKDKYDRRVVRTFTSELYVVDEEPPVIEMKETEIKIIQNFPFNVEVYVDSIYDPYDGELQYCVQPGRGGYSTMPKIDTSELGKTELQILATDVNGNQTTEKLVVNVVSPMYDYKDPTYYMVEQGKAQGDYGRLWIPDVDFAVPLYFFEGSEEENQKVVDKEDCALVSGLWGPMTIFDHNYQGFRKMMDSVPGQTIAYRFIGSEVEIYCCVSKYEVPKNPDSIWMEENEDVYSIMDSDYAMQTCTDDDERNCVTYWVRMP